MKSPQKLQIILAVGLPGSGKSTYFQKRHIQPLSSDTLRSWLLDDETDQSQQYRVFLTLRYLLELRLKLGQKKSFVDATNLTRKERRRYFDLAKRYGGEVHAIYFETPLATCMRRNRRRQRRVPDEVIERMARKLAPPTLEEGFTKITIVRK